MRKFVCPSKQWTLPQVVRANRSAVIVWVGLTRRADQSSSPMVTVSRGDLAESVGLQTNDKKNISRALSTLKKAGWIFVEYFTLTGASGFARVMRIWLHTSPVNMYTGLFGSRAGPKRSKVEHTREKKEADKTVAVQETVDHTKEIMPRCIAAGPLDEVKLSQASVETLNQIAHELAEDSFKFDGYYKRICQGEEFNVKQSSMQAWHDELRDRVATVAQAFEKRGISV